MSPKVGIEPIRQAQIIDAALSLIAQQGSHNVSIQSVATEAGLSKGAVLHYYPTKNDLFAAVFREYFRRVFERINTTMTGHDDPLEKLGSIGDWLFDETDPFVVIAYPLYLECMSRALYEELFHRVFQDWVTDWVKLVKTIIEEGIEKSDFKAVDPEPCARTLSAFCQGVASRWYLDRENHSADWAREALRNHAEALLKKQ